LPEKRDTGKTRVSKTAPRATTSPGARTAPRPPAREGAAGTPAPAAVALPPLAAEEPDGAHGAALDRYDVAILGELQRDARLTNAELAARIGLSAAPTWRRVKWLEEQGYITGYRAEIDRRRIGLGVLAFVRVDAERNNAEATRVLEDRIRALPEVISCHYISGSGTFELQVMATDLDAYSRWSMDTLFRLPNVKDLHTSFSLGEVKAGAALPLGHLQGAR
jgi:DNA-binding Lrp family transcriptional regulator